MENNQLYLMQITRRVKQNIEELKSLNSRLRNENIEIQEMQQAIRMLDQAQPKIEQEIKIINKK